MDAYVARQPIFNRRKKIFGYELLFRNAKAKYVPDIDGDTATSTVLGNSFFNIGMDNLIDGKKSFINFTQNLILQKVPMLLPSKETVVEILEDVEPTPELLNVCREMAQKGYTIALDDFTYSPKLRPLIEIANIIKFDFRSNSADEIQVYLSKIQRHSKLSILAEKIESYDEYKKAREMGFDYFQGFFFCKPELIKGKDISGSQMNLLQIMVEVNQPDFNFANLEKLIAPDVALSYKLLRYINSAYFAKAQDIASIQQALVYMGEAEIRRFVSLVAMSNLAKGKPEELIRAACIRAKFCELLGGVTPWPAKPAELFMLGMFSLINAILDQPMERIMKDLPLAQTIKNALVHRKGQLIGYLGLIEYYEKGQFGLMSRVANALGILPATFPKLYNQACQWANSFPAPE
ncbi:MAG: HDOD domain-containing protein [Desulfobacteraceae bacterium]|nr:MAG: HDOD domain-containing protein [Desulfobacteraceae bacterium]